MHSDLDKKGYQMAHALPTVKVQCLNCSYKTGNESDFLNHVRVHTLESNFKIPCMFCPQSLGSIKHYKIHKKVCVGQKSLKEETEVSQGIESSQFWICKNCCEKIKVNAIQNINDFTCITKHCFQHARNTENVFCPFCDASYNNYKSFHYHIQRHKNREEFKIHQKHKSEVPFLQKNLNVILETPATMINTNTDDVIEEVDSNLIKGIEFWFQNQTCVNCCIFLFFLV